MQLARHWTCLSFNNCLKLGKAFSSFHNLVGQLGIDEVVSPMLDEFSRNQNVYILDGLCAIMSGSSGRSLFNNLLTKLSKPPVNSMALCRFASSIPEDSLSRNLSRILEALLNSEINTSIEEVKNLIFLTINKVYLLTMFSMSKIAYQFSYRWNRMKT